MYLQLVNFSINVDFLTTVVNFRVYNRKKKHKWKLCTYVRIIGTLIYTLNNFLNDNCMYMYVAKILIKLTVCVKVGKPSRPTPLVPPIPGGKNYSQKIFLPFSLQEFPKKIFLSKN